MRVQRFHRRGKVWQAWLAWLSCIAILLNTAMPTVSHALAAGAGGMPVWLDICTTTGPVRAQWTALSVAAAQAGGAADAIGGLPLAKALFDHCPYCPLQAGSPALPSAAARLALPLHGSELLPPLYLHAPRTLAVWATAQARAPPAAA